MSKLGAEAKLQLEREKAAEAILACRADSAVAAVLTAARATGWQFSNRPTKAND